MCVYVGRRQCVHESRCRREEGTIARARVDRNDSFVPERLRHPFVNGRCSIWRVDTANSGPPNFGGRFAAVLRPFSSPLPPRGHVTSVRSHVATLAATCAIGGALVGSSAGF